MIYFCAVRRNRKTRAFFYDVKSLAMTRQRAERLASDLDSIDPVVAAEQPVVRVEPVRLVSADTLTRWAQLSEQVLAVLNGQVTPLVRRDLEDMIRDVRTVGSGVGRAAR